MQCYRRDHRRADVAHAVSRLSPYLARGDLSARRVYHVAAAAEGAEGAGRDPAAVEKFLTRLLWRDMMYMHLALFPEMPTACVRPQYAARRDWAEARAAPARPPLEPR